jgi:hypothetical protein
MLPRSLQVVCFFIPIFARSRPTNKNIARPRSELTLLKARLNAQFCSMPNPVAAVNVSPAYLLRKVGSEEGVTLLYDEIDTVRRAKMKNCVAH